MTITFPYQLMWRKKIPEKLLIIKVLNQEIAETVRKIDVLRASINEIVKEMDDGE